MTQRNAETKKAILNHLAKYPQSKGTLDSIAEWWILEQRIDQYVANVQAALSELVEEGMVVEQRRPDHPVLYEVNRERLLEIRDLTDVS